MTLLRHFWSFIMWAWNRKTLFILNALEINSPTTFSGKKEEIKWRKAINFLAHTHTLTLNTEKYKIFYLMLGRTVSKLRWLQSGMWIWVHTLGSSVENYMSQINQSDPTVLRIHVFTKIHWAILNKTTQNGFDY